MQKIIAIAAAAENNALGKDNDLLWHLPDDFKRFKKLTTGNPIVMGRKTFESFPKPLPNRKHIVITRDKSYTINYNNCVVVHSLEDALKITKDNELVYIIGGGEIYKLALEYTHKIELTRVHTEFDADTFFPELDKNNWEIVFEEYHPKDEKHKIDFTYITYIRKC
ncbi:dihydrofolate reductase [Cellulophaga omnivescoria]|uniref:dihydrofolate reductase n=1 Tax=Cellulophaga omnivescoria TaxID=1888890 RepID=UPI0022F0CA24|nr:dihydrofolate reductase [Cellulophaga omnivescoria]WBU88141.1 dihydrofolate reductase [Cellulophaga omnivescoria]